MIYSTLLMLCSFVSHDIPDGSLLFVEGGSNAVMTHTNSPYSHVALIFNIDEEPWVYEAVKPVVRKIKLSDYIREIEAENKKRKKLMKLWIKKPKVKINTTTMLKYLNDQLGRKYSIGSYITGDPQDKIHCGELTARALIAGKIKVHGNPCKKTPQGIMNLSRPYYRKARMI
mgnify:CR=1 FL=1